MVLGLFDYLKKKELSKITKVRENSCRMQDVAEPRHRYTTETNVTWMSIADILETGSREGF